MGPSSLSPARGTHWSGQAALHQGVIDNVVEGVRAPVVLVLAPDAAAAPALVRRASGRRGRAGHVREVDLHAEELPLVGCVLHVLPDSLPNADLALLPAFRLGGLPVDADGALPSHRFPLLRKRPRDCGAGRSDFVVVRHAKGVPLRVTPRDGARDPLAAVEYESHPEASRTLTHSRRGDRLPLALLPVGQRVRRFRNDVYAHALPPCALVAWKPRRLCNTCATRGRRLGCCMLPSR